MEHIINLFTTQSGVAPFVIGLMGAVALDYVTGLVKALYAHNLKSHVAKEGLIRKFALFAVVAACGLIDMVLPVETGYGICKLSALSFTVSEVVSVLENAAAVGVPIPESIAKRLAQLTDSDKEE